MDLYSVLDLTPAATPADIERAYLRLARRFHPGINPGDRLGAERFRQVQQAYEVLADAGRRRQYDAGRLRHATVEAAVEFDGFDFSTAAQGAEAATFSELFADVFQDAARRAVAAAQGTNLELTMQVAFEEAVRGGAIPISVTRRDRCTACGGSGAVALDAPGCPTCEGRGVVRWARGHMVFSKTCAACGGSGEMSRSACRSCAGSGLQARHEVVTVHLPAGIASGARLVVPGRGHAGERGGDAGDLYVTVDVMPHRVFRRDGRDLLVTVPVAIHEAALGARIEVPTLSGPVKTRIPPGTGNGARLRIRGHGVPDPDSPDGAGALIAEIQLTLPLVRDERSKALLREFAQLNPVDVRAHLFDDEKEKHGP